MKKIFYLLAIAGIIHLVSCSTTGKTTNDENTSGMKQKNFSNEQIQADALATANINCQWEVAKYNASLQENNRKLNEKEKSLYKLKFAFDQKMKIRYLQIEDLTKKYNKALEKAKKQLSACVKLKEIRKMEEEQAKEKAERGTP